MDYFGRIMDEGGFEVMPVDDDDDDGFFGVAQLQPQQDLQPGQDVQPEEVQEAQQEAEGHEIAPPLEAEGEEEKVAVGEMELTKYSAIRYLRNACRYLGMNQAGSRERMFNRIVETNKIAMRRQHLKLHKGSMKPRWFKQKLCNQLCVNLRLMKGGCVRLRICHVDKFTNTKRKIREQGLQCKWTLAMHAVTIGRRREDAHG